MGKAITVQVSFAGRCDNGNETGATWKYADGSCGDSAANAKGRDWTQLVDQIFRVRLLIEETDGGSEVQAFELRYAVGGSYLDITNATPIQYTESAEDGWTITDQDGTTEQLAGASTFVTGEYSEDALTEVITLNAQETELEFCLKIDSAQVTDEDVITLQVWFSGDIALDSYTDTPSITVDKPAAARRIFVTHV